MLAPLPDSYPATRDGLHALAEHVIAPARYRADGHIGLRATPGGFGTPKFGDDERIRVEGNELVHERPGSTRRMPITTLDAAAQFLGTTVGAPTEVYKPATEAVPDASLWVSADGSHALAAWIAFADGLLAELRHSYTGQVPSEVQIWPEHFDIGCDFGDANAGTRANYGASPGDENISEPYLYAGPWDDAKRTGRFARCKFGAAVTYSELQAADRAESAGLEFYLDCAALLVGAP